MKLKMEKTIELVGFGKIRCLHCGELIDLEKDIHLCSSERNAWLNKTDKALVKLPNGDVWDLKNKCMVKSKN